MDFRHSQITIRRSQIRAFTLTELLVVIGLIVLLISLAVPTFSALRGSNSVENATNVVSASLARARAEAVGLQRPFGIAFYREAASARFAMALVEIKTPASWTPSTPYSTGDWVKHPTNSPTTYHVAASDFTSGTNPSELSSSPWRPLDASANAAINSTTNPAQPIDLVEGSDRLLLPTGIAAATASDTYAPTGVILFDENGTLSVKNCLLAKESLLWREIEPTPVSSTALTGLSQIGVMLFNDEDSKSTTLAYDAFIEQFATPLLVNRYNGTIVKGE